MRRLTRSCLGVTLSLPLVVFLVGLLVSLALPGWYVNLLRPCRTANAASDAWHRSLPLELGNNYVNDWHSNCM